MSVAWSLLQEPSSFPPEPGEMLGHPRPWVCHCPLLYCCQEGDSKFIAGCAWPLTGKPRANANQRDIHQLLAGGQRVVVPVALKPQRLSELPPCWEQIVSSRSICFLQARKKTHWVFGTDSPFLLLGSALGIFFSLVPAVSSCFTWRKCMMWSLEKPAGKLSARKDCK